jgi:hypothetical protein
LWQTKFDFESLRKEILEEKLCNIIHTKNISIIEAMVAAIGKAKVVLGD